jgi:hypothetical protein
VTRKCIVLSVALATAIVLTAGATGCASSPSAPASPAAEPQLKAAVTRFTELLEPVRPAKFYGKQLTPVRCVSLMKGRDAQLSEVAAGEAFAQERSGSSTLAGLIRQEQELARSYGGGTIPTGCRGEVGYWRVLSGGGDEYVVRAAVLDTVDHGRWDAARRELTDTGSFGYSEAMAYDYTLRKVDGAWKVVARRFTGLSFTRAGSSLHPDSA